MLQPRFRTIETPTEGRGMCSRIAGSLKALREAAISAMRIANARSVGACRGVCVGGRGSGRAHQHYLLRCDVGLLDGPPVTDRQGTLRQVTTNDGPPPKGNTFADYCANPRLSTALAGVSIAIGRGWCQQNDGRCCAPRPRPAAAAAVPSRVTQLMACSPLNTTSL